MHIGICILFINQLENGRDLSLGSRGGDEYPIVFYPLVQRIFTPPLLPLTTLRHVLPSSPPPFTQAYFPEVILELSYHGDLLRACEVRERPHARDRERCVFFTPSMLGEEEWSVACE